MRVTHVSIRPLRWIVVLGLAVMAGAISLAMAQTPTTEPAAPADLGSVAGVVLKDNQPVADVTVRLLPPPPEGRLRHHRMYRFHADAATQPSEKCPTCGCPCGGASGDPAAAEGRKMHRGDQPDRPEPLATATTDADGKFTFTGVVPGDYVIVAGQRGLGRGHERIALTSGQTIDVTLELQTRPRDGRGMGRHGGRGHGPHGPHGGKPTETPPPTAPPAP